MEALKIKLPPKIREAHGKFPELSSEEYDRMRTRWANDVHGTLSGGHCPICNDRGYTVEIRNGCSRCAECACMAKRRSLERIKNSGLGDLLDRYTFSSYQTAEPWQKKAKETAYDYIRNNDRKWFVASGSVGAGKSHLCTAICGELLNAGLEVRYMLWREDGVQMKACVNDSEEYGRLVNPLKNVRVLYIDDFWKGKVSEGDKNLAIDLLGHRYNDRRLITILSTELSIPEMMGIDEAVGSRIYERSKLHYLHFTGQKNWRLKG